MKKQNVIHAVLKQPIKVQEIKISHPHFRKFDEYHVLDNKILRIITGIETASQDELKK